MFKKKPTPEQILSDVKYFESLIETETKKITDDINQHLNGHNSADKMGALVDCIAASLAKITARIEVIEAVLTAEQPMSAVAIDNMSNTVANINVVAEKPQLVLQPTLADKVVLTSAELVELPNFHPTEKTDTGLSYNWTGENKATELKLAVSRKRSSELKVRVVSVLYPDTLKNLQVIVDGEPLTHRIEFDGEFDCIIATLPIRKNKIDETTVCINLADVFTPKLLKKSDDERHLGMAVNLVSIAKPEKRKRRLFKRK